LWIRAGRRGEAPSRGSALACGYRPATPLELAASAAEYVGPFCTIRAYGVLRLAVLAAELIATVSAADVERVNAWHPTLVARARALGVLAPSPPSPPALEAA
jgi:hypothetical protein